MEQAIKLRALMTLPHMINPKTKRPIQRGEEFEADQQAARDLEREARAERVESPHKPAAKDAKA